MYYKMYIDIVNKDIITTHRIPIIQRQNLNDKIMVTVPKFYGDLQMQDCIVIMQFANPANVVFTKKVDLVEYEGDEDFLVGYIPIDLEFTTFSGEITNLRFRIGFVAGNDVYDFYTKTTTMTIESNKDIYTMNDTSMDYYDDLFIELERKANEIAETAAIYDQEKADNIVSSIDEDHNVKVQLTSHGELIGEEVVVGDDGTQGTTAVDFEVSRF